VKTGITVRCRVPCDLKGLAKVTVPKSVAGKRAGAARNVTVVVATLSKKLGAGKQAKIVMRLSRKGMKILRKVHKMRMKVAVTATAAGALPVKANRTLTVKAPKKRGH
jgi:hypothetical protein